jgi:glycogen synthase
VIYGGLGTAVGGWVRASAGSGMGVAVLLVGGALAGETTASGYWGSSAAGLAGTERVVETEGVTFFQTAFEAAAERGVSVVERWRPDILHLHTAMLWPVAREIQRRTGVPLVYHVHSVDRAEYEIGKEPNLWLAHSHAQEEAIEAAGRLIALSDSERDLLVSYYPSASGRIRVVGNGIADSEAARKASERHRPPEDVVILYSGRLVERKGIRELLAAAPRVLAAVPSARFVLVGGPPPLSGEEVARQWLPDELAGERERIFFTGWLSPDRVEEWYRAADVLVVPSRYEPFGMVLLEGMLHGLAIVASATGGPAEIVRDEESGLLFPPLDVDKLAHALIRVATSADLRERLGHQGAADVRARWMWPARVRRMRNVYSELMQPVRAKSSPNAVLLAT